MQNSSRGAYRNLEPVMQPLEYSMQCCLPQLRRDNPKLKGSDEIPT